MYLKELRKAKRRTDKMIAPRTFEYKQGYKDGYAKAIGDLTNELLSYTERNARKFICTEYSIEFSEQIKNIRQVLNK